MYFGGIIYSIYATLSQNSRIMIRSNVWLKLSFLGKPQALTQICVPIIGPSQHYPKMVLQQKGSKFSNIQDLFLEKAGLFDKT